VVAPLPVQDVVAVGGDQQASRLEVGAVEDHHRWSQRRFRWAVHFNALAPGGVPAECARTGRGLLGACPGQKPRQERPQLCFGGDIGAALCGGGAAGATSPPRSSGRRRAVLDQLRSAYTTGRGITSIGHRTCFQGMFRPPSPQIRRKKSPDPYEVSPP
jgi:hypothetical protein